MQAIVTVTVKRTVQNRQLQIWSLRRWKSRRETVKIVKNVTHKTTRDIQEGEISIHGYQGEKRTQKKRFYGSWKDDIFSSFIFI